MSSGHHNNTDDHAEDEEVRSKAQYHHTYQQEDGESDLQSQMFQMLKELQGAMHSVESRMLSIEEAQAQSASATSIDHHMAQSATECEDQQETSQREKNSTPEVQSTHQRTLSPPPKWHHKALG